MFVAHSLAEFIDVCGLYCHWRPGGGPWPMFILETMEMFKVSVVTSNHIEVYDLCSCWLQRKRGLHLEWYWLLQIHSRETKTWGVSVMTSTLSPCLPPPQKITDLKGSHQSIELGCWSVALWSWWLLAGVQVEKGSVFFRRLGVQWAHGYHKISFWLSSLFHLGGGDYKGGEQTWEVWEMSVTGVHNVNFPNNQKY